MRRVRRARLLVFFAAAGLLLVWRFARGDDWTRAFSFGPDENGASDKGVRRAAGTVTTPPAVSPSSDDEDEDEDGLGSGSTTVIRLPKLKHDDDDVPAPFSRSNSGDGPRSGVGAPKSSAKAAKSANPTTRADNSSSSLRMRKPQPKLTPSHADAPRKEAAAGQRLLNPMRKLPWEQADRLTSPSGPNPSAVMKQHWKKFPEHFPLDVKDIRPLPTGKPKKKIPRVQHDFAAEEEETAQARSKREFRQAKVKSEFERAWAGYKEYAWMHDELRPVSGDVGDAFGGWAATLVDSLDTLWIMGLKSDFDEAVAAVEKIDFTVASQPEIPVFETTIRHLGGLIGAFDISGGRQGNYTVLLDKAVELAEILMGIFDTPNRMPILYYNWLPMHVVKAKRSSQDAVLAQLGSLLLEFTRLAQITKQAKYYDAVDRISDALEDWQNRGTTIPGIFPEKVDAAGCNRTAAEEMAWDSAFETLVGHPIDELREEEKRSAFLEGRSSPEDKLSLTKIYQRMLEQHSAAKPYRVHRVQVDYCYPQGLTAASPIQAFGVGSNQDSTYEYFAKQWLLLGGVEGKYRKLHLDTIDAVKKWLLFRPMLPDERDVLFSAKITTKGEPEKDAQMAYEGCHLSCFLGGMFAMGGRIFEAEVDIDVGRKLTDGCVWAYEATPSGIMPEEALLAPCADANNCSWNETLYWKMLDPKWAIRDELIAEYDRRKAENEKQKLSEEREQAELKAATKRKTEDGIAGGGQKKGTEKEGEKKRTERVLETRRRGPGRVTKRADDAEGKQGTGPSLKATEKATERATERATEKASEPAAEPASPMAPQSTRDKQQKPLLVGYSKVEADTTSISQVPSKSGPADEAPDMMPDPSRPLSHEEYVKSRIKNERLPPGYTDIKVSSYLLRPEAIESVWYMYRITGDPVWQDKGWKMFTAIIAATKTDIAHSAVNDVMSAVPTPRDGMESFWLAETLKYFYLLYSTPDVVSLDEWVLNTEAHPFRRPT